MPSSKALSQMIQCIVAWQNPQGVLCIMTPMSIVDTISARFFKNEFAIQYTVSVTILVGFVKHKNHPGSVKPCSWKQNSEKINAQKTCTLKVTLVYAIAN